MIRPQRVIKIGGSLLGWPAIADHLDGYLGQLESDRLVLIVGGGEPVEWLRRIDARATWGDAAAHDAAIAMMDANTRAVAGWLPTAKLTDSWDKVTHASDAAGVLLFAAGRFLREQEPSLPGTCLPVGWQVTSDSIAARVAALLDAPLTLIKSCGVETPRSREGWLGLADRGVVDAFFPRLVDEPPSVEIVTLRGA